jgi:hypothetical protein
MRKFALFFVLMCFVLSSCSNNDSNDEEMMQGEAVVVVNVIEFTYTPATDVTGARLVYNIDMTNTSIIDAQGGLVLTYSADGLVFSSIPTSESYCYQIPANTTCNISFDETESLDIITADSVVFISAEYVFF